MRRVNQPQTAWTDDRGMSALHSELMAPVVQDFTLIYCLDNFIYTLCTYTGRSGGRQSVMDVRTACFVTVRSTFGFFYFHSDVREETPVEICWHWNVCLLYNVCAFSMEVTWNVSSLSWCVWIFHDNTPFLSPMCLFFNVWGWFESREQWCCVSILLYK